MKNWHTYLERNLALENSCSYQNPPIRIKTISIECFFLQVPLLHLSFFFQKSVLFSFFFLNNDKFYFSTKNLRLLIFTNKFKTKMGLFGTSSPFDPLLDKTCNENVVTEDWSLILSICDKARASPKNAKDCLTSITKKIQHKIPRVALQGTVSSSFDDYIYSN